jgi:hypothetical protein
LALLQRFERATYNLSMSTHKFLHRDASFADVETEAALIGMHDGRLLCVLFDVSALLCCV